MSLDDDFFILRRFGSLSARVVLRQQNEIVELEKELEAEDRLAIADSQDSGTFCNDPRPKRRKLLNKLAFMIERYRTAASSYSKVKA